MLPGLRAYPFVPHLRKPDELRLRRDHSLARHATLAVYGPYGRDISRNNLTVTASSSAPTVRLGNIGSSMEFSGTSQEYSYPNHQVINSARAFTIATRVYLDAYTSGSYPEIFILANNLSLGFKMFASNDGSYRALSFGANDWVRMRDNTTGASFPTATWMDIAVGYNGEGPTSSSNFSLYVDGESKTISTPASGFLGTGSSNVIAADDTSGTNEWDGVIDYLVVLDGVNAPEHVARARQVLDLLEPHRILVPVAAAGGGPTFANRLPLLGVG